MFTLERGIGRGLLSCINTEPPRLRVYMCFCLATFLYGCVSLARPLQDTPYLNTADPALLSGKPAAALVLRSMAGGPPIPPPPGSTAGTLDLTLLSVYLVWAFTVLALIECLV